MCLGIPGQLVEFVDVNDHLARVDVSGVTRIINIGLLEDEGLEPGDWVLIHVGFAMSKIDEEEAALALASLQLMGQAYGDELDAFWSSADHQRAPRRLRWESSSEWSSATRSAPGPASRAGTEFRGGLEGDQHLRGGPGPGRGRALDRPGAGRAAAASTWPAPWATADRVVAAPGGLGQPVRFVDEYRDPTAARALVAQITELAGDDEFKFMEVCGGHTHTIYRHGIEHVLPAIGRAGPRARAARCASSRWAGSTTPSPSPSEPGVIFTSLRRHDAGARAAGATCSQAKAEGADVRFVYSPLDALQDRHRQSRPRGRVLRRRLRDHRPVHRAHPAAGPGQRRPQLLRVLQPRHHRPADQGHPRVAGPAARRLPRPRARVDGRRPAALPVRAGRLRQAPGHGRASSRSTSCRPSPCC